MKKIILTILVLFSFQIGNSQIINEPANWPNANWTTSGTYNADGLLADPTSADSFTFDDDAAGSTSDDDIASESPVIDLSAAAAASENLILISGDFTHRDIGGSLSVDYWDYDAGAWVALIELETTGASTADYQNCTNQVYFESGLDITGFSATQLSNFKYRISYDDADGWQWGWCIKNVSVVSGGAAVPGCDAVVTSPADGESGVVQSPTINWSSASGFPDGYYVSVGTTAGGNDILDNVDTGNSNSYPLSGLAYSTTYYVTILPYNGSGSATDECSSSSFTTVTDPNTYVDCNAGPINTSFCYDTGLDNSYSFTSLDGSPMNLTINSGQVENGWDELIILDSDGTELYNGYGAGGDISGLTFQSSGDNITLIVQEDGSISCTSSGYNPIDFTVACPTCVSPIAVNDGTITINTNSGLSPFEYSIDNGVTFFDSNTFSNLAPGDYNVVVMGATGLCTFEQTIYVGACELTSVNIVATTASSVVSTDGSIMITPTSGEGPYLYSIDGGQSFDTNNVFSGLPIGTYNIVVQDSAQICFYEESIPLRIETMVINEINYRSIDSFNPDDWIELYNPESTIKDVSNWKIKDDNDSHVFVIPEGTQVEANGYLIIVKDEADFTTAFPGIPYIGELGFGFGGSDEVRLYTSDDKLVDEVKYESESPWPTCAYETGNTLELITPELDNSLPESWNCINENGSPNAVNSSSLYVENMAYSLIKIFPNPVKNSLYISGDSSNYNIKIYSLLGQLVMAASNVGEVDVSSFTKGVYLIKISNENSTTTKRFIKL